jgi:hypothetical protein
MILLMNCTSPVNRKYRTKDSSPHYSNTRDLTGEQKDTIQHRQLRLRPRQLPLSQQSLSRSRMVGTADETRASSMVSKDPRESRAQLPHRLHTLEQSALSIRRQHTGTCRKPFTARLQPSYPYPNSIRYLVKKPNYIYSETVRMFEKAGFKTTALLATGRTSNVVMRKTI